MYTEKLLLNPIISDSSFGTNNPRQNSGCTSGTQGCDIYDTASLAWQHAGQTSLKNKGRQCHMIAPMPMPALLALSFLSRTWAALGEIPKSNDITQTVLGVCVSVHRPVAVRSCGAVQIWGGVCGPHAHHPCPVGPGLSPWRPALTTAGKQGLWGCTTEK